MNDNVYMTSQLNQFPYYPSSHTYKCFPVRNVRKFNQDDGGAWVVEFRTEKKRQLDLLKSKAFSRKKKVENGAVTEFTASYLMKRFCVDEPSDLCCINVSGNDLHAVKNEHFSVFNNMVTIDASDNHLSVETFQSFPKLEELQLQVNKIKCVHVTHNDFICLHKLILSYNTIRERAILNLGKLRNLKELHLQGCELTKLPPELAQGYQVSKSDSQEKEERGENIARFPELTYLNLSENELTDISTFASVAGLKKLKSLNLSGNKITGVPHLRLMVTHRHFSLSTCDTESMSLPDNNTSTKILISAKPSVRHNTSKATPLTAHENVTNIDAVNKELTTCVPEDVNVSFGEEVSKAVEDAFLNDNDEETNKLLNMNFGNELNFNFTDEATEVCKEINGDFADGLLNDELKRPFSCLETLDISCNQIADEESLLALTSWPALQVLKVWGNPLMLAFKGTPPVLVHHLQKMCGIDIHRKEPKEKTLRNPVAPSIVSTAKAYRVKTELPPIRRNNLLMIEAAIASAIENKKVSKKEKEEEEGEEEEKEEEEKVKVDDCFFHPHNISSEVERNNENNIFITQVDDVDEKEIKEELKKKKNKVVAKKYRGYELLLQSDEQTGKHGEDLPLPSSIQGSVLALKHILDNPLVFNEGEYNSNKIKVHKRKKKSRLIKSAPLKQHTDKVADALNDIRLKETSYQDNLDSVLKNYHNDPEIRKRYPEAKKLMRKVQKRYDEVRLNSLRPVSVAQDQIGRIGTRTDRPSRELILSRMKQGKIGDLYSSSRRNTPSPKFRGTTPRIEKT